jgi:hypothetical protein
VFTGSWFGGRREETTGVTQEQVEDNTKPDLREIGIYGANWI